VDSHHRRGRLALLAATAIVAALAAVSGASAATTCTGTITSGSFQSIVVPPGETCELFAVNGDVIEVAGSISVGQGAILFVRALEQPSCGQIVIRGSVAATNPFAIVFLADSGCTLRVDGSISVRGASEPVRFQGILVGGSVVLRDNDVAGSVRILDSIIDGSVTVRNNNAATEVIVANNSIGGSVNFSNNVGPVTAVADNAIGGSLACSGNSGSLIETFGPNTVGGSPSGQCA
jgi:hypothetical protein